MSGPLSGLRVVEMLGIGPSPFCGMLLADLGADVVRVERPVRGDPHSARRPQDVLGRGRRSIGINLKAEGASDVVLDLIAASDVVIEGFRPGVMERLGLGPDECLARNPRLVYGRMTGWGQDGPLASRAGHDVNYIAVAGVLGTMGERESPPPVPLNLVGDFGGGGMLLALGVLSALFDVRRSDCGQVVDAAIVDGSATLLSMMYAMMAQGRWIDDRASNLLDGAAPYYSTYATSDGRYVALGAIEDRFYAELLDVLGFAPDELPDREDRTQWPVLRATFAERIGGRPLSYWIRAAEDRDACLAPVNTLTGAAEDSHLRNRRTFATVDGVVQPSPAPRFSRTKPRVPPSAPVPGRDTDSVLRSLHLTAERLAALRSAGVFG